MNRPSEQRVATLGALIRKQEWDIAELQVGHAQAKELVEKLSFAADKLDFAIADAETALRFSSSNVLSVDSIQCTRRFLAQQQRELTKVLHERRRSEALAEEFARKIAERRAAMRGYERLSNRMRTELAIAVEKAEMRNEDELWLTRVGG